MDKKRILIVSRSFYPMNSPRSFRTTELAKELARQGHDVTVLTPKVKEVHDQFERGNGLKVWDLGKPSWNPAKIKGKGVERFIRRALKRFPSLLFEYPNIELMGMVANKLNKASGYDMLISIAVPYPIHWGVARVWKSKGQDNPAKIWIADCGDPYVGQENDSFKIPFYFSWVEKWFMRKPDYITIPIKGAKRGYFEEFYDKMRVIPQGFHFEDIQNQALHREKIVKFAYAGSFIPGRRDPREFCEFLIKQDVDYEFHVYTQHADLIKPYVAQSKSHIIVKDYVPREQLLFELSALDFMVNFENVGQKQLPSKIIDYLIIDKPILSVKTGDLDKKTVLEFLNKNYKGKRKTPDRNCYRIENVVKNFLALGNV